MLHQAHVQGSGKRKLFAWTHLHPYPLRQLVPVPVPQALLPQRH
jgi:hypothetical protein